MSVRRAVRADPNLSHRADRILSQGWKPTQEEAASQPKRLKAGHIGDLRFGGKQRASQLSLSRLERALHLYRQGAAEFADVCIPACAGPQTGHRC
jgi:hypothetical protein